MDRKTGTQKYKIMKSLFEIYSGNFAFKLQSMNLLCTKTT